VGEPAQLLLNLKPGGESSLKNQAQTRVEAQPSLPAMQRCQTEQFGALGFIVLVTQQVRNAELYGARINFLRQSKLSRHLSTRKIISYIILIIILIRNKMSVEWGVSAVGNQPKVVGAPECKEISREMNK
jgi:hypothetical protein